MWTVWVGVARRQVSEGLCAERLTLMAAKYADDPTGAAIIAASRQEIAVRRAHGASYGYAFYIARR